MSRYREAQRQNALLSALFNAEPVTTTVPTAAAPIESTGASTADGFAATAASTAMATATVMTTKTATASSLPAAGFAEHGERLRRGLGAYRANATGIAERALAAAYPTLTALVGPDDGAALARALWRASPPQRGDLAEWGRDLPEFIEAQRDLDPWPYLADCARLDAALQRCEAAADAALEADTLALLAEAAPQAIVLRLLPCVQLLHSPWPVASLHAAHAAGTGEDGSAVEGPLLDAARAALTERRGESVVVARRGWRAVAQAVDAPTFAWMRALQVADPLDAALALAGEGFDVDAWLLQALQQHWLWKAETRPSAPGPLPPACLPSARLPSHS